jgi:hypothetical protein
MAKKEQAVRATIICFAAATVLACGCSAGQKDIQSPIKDGLSMAWHWVDGENSYEMHYAFRKTGTDAYTVAYVTDSRYRGGHDRQPITEWTIDNMFRRRSLGETDVMMVQGCPIWIDPASLREGKDARWRVTKEETVLGRTAYKAQDSVTPAVGWFDCETGLLLISELNDGSASVRSELIESNADGLIKP